MDNSFKILASSKSSRIQGAYNPLKFHGISVPDASDVTGWGDIDMFCNKYGFYQENPVEDLLSGCKHKEPDQEQPDEELFLLHHSKSTFLSSGHIPQLNNSQGGPSSLTEDQETVNKVTLSGKCANQTEILQKLSTEKILRLAGERFVQFSSQQFTNTSTFAHPYESSLSGLHSEDKQDVELAQLLLAAAEKVRPGSYDRAGKLLDNCQWIASTTGTPVQRIVSYFSEALVKRIRRETGSEEKLEKVDANSVQNDIMAVLDMQDKLPFFQVVNLTVAQTLLENVKMKSKVHIIDFHILRGLHLAAFMQDLAMQEMESVSLKLTIVETVDEQSAHRSGKRLACFAKHLNLPFSYKVVFLSSIIDLKEEHFDLKGDETVALIFHFMLRKLISKPICLKNLMTVIQKIRPSVMVVAEVEANHNSPSFVNRFIEAMFFYGALFDSLEEIMARDSQHRMRIESRICRPDILDIVAAEGYDRVIRSVSINVWRAFFGRFGMIEMELSTASVYQACLVLDQLPRGEWCTLDIGSKCLLVGWKGTPIFSVSAWKFP